MIYGLLSLQAPDERDDPQKEQIGEYVREKNLPFPQWIYLDLPLWKSIRSGKDPIALEKLGAGDIILVSELFRMGRSLMEVFQVLDTLVTGKQCRLIILKQELDINPWTETHLEGNLLLKLLFQVGQLERDFISQRTKAGLRGRKAKGILLGKPKGVIQSSKYDVDQDKILSLYTQGVPLSTIVRSHLKYGTYLSLKKYVQKRFPTLQPISLPSGE